MSRSAVFTTAYRERSPLYFREGGIHALVGRGSAAKRTQRSGTTELETTRVAITTNRLLNFSFNTFWVCNSTSLMMTRQANAPGVPHTYRSPMISDNLNNKIRTAQERNDVRSLAKYRKGSGGCSRYSSRSRWIDLLDSRKRTRIESESTGVQIFKNRRRLCDATKERERVCVCVCVCVRVRVRV